MVTLKKYIISVINHSMLITDAEVQAITTALQIQIVRDFAPIWNITAQVSFDNGSKGLKKGVWQLGFFDNSDEAGALGYHDVTTDGLPLGKIFVGDDLKYGDSPSVTASHEILEMLSDPGCQKTYRRGLRKYAYEVCDAVENDDLGYKIGDVQVSNFVTPAYFSAFKQAPYDFMKQLTRPIPAMEPGGYLAYYQGGQWHQIFAQTAGGIGDKKTREYRKRPTKGSRRYLRTIPIKERIWSI